MNQTGDLSFVPPPPAPVSGADVGELQNPAVIEVSTDPLERNAAQVVPLDRLLGNKDYEGMFWIRIPVGVDLRGGFRQLGRFPRDASKRADGALIPVDPDYLCLPTLTKTTANVSPPSGTINRIHSASIFGVQLYSGFEAAATSLWQETSATNPVPLAVPGFTAPAGASFLMCMAPIQINGVPYLAVGYQTAAANTLQIISSISAFASSTVPVGTAGTCGVIQTPIDGNALLVYQYLAGTNGAGQIRAISTDVAAGATAVSGIRSTLNGGGYAVGLSAWEGQAAAYWCEPSESDLWTPGFAPPAAPEKTRLLRTDLRGYLPSVVDVPLRWVTFATKVRGGIVVCDQQTHYFLAPGRKIKRMSVFDDFPQDANMDQWCRGHYSKDGRFLMEVNDAKSPGVSAGTTKRYLMEWDFDLWRAGIVSSKQTTSLNTGTPSAGGANLPWSPYTGYVTSHTQDAANGTWYYAFQPSIGVNLFNLRRSSSTNLPTEYEATESITTTDMVIDGYEDCRLNLIAITGPRASLIAEGGAGATVGVEELRSGLTGLTSNGRGALFTATEPDAAATGDRAERRVIQSTAWTYSVQFRITLNRTTTSDLPTHWTPNGSPIYAELIAVRKPVKVPTAQILRALDAQRGD